MVRIAKWSWGFLESLKEQKELWKARRKAESRGVHQGLERGEGLFTGVCVVIRALILLQCVSNHSSNWERETDPGGEGGTKSGRTGRMESQSVLSQLRVGGGALK